jgi:DNA-3-methyladenine glycosylase
MSILGPDFYHQNACLVARQLLGATLVRMIDGERVSGKIVETEAYTGLDDLASHGRAGRTPRNLPMWEAPGYAYIYLTYGIYWLLNVVCEPADQPAAVLIRALEPLEGLEVIARNRPGRKLTEWTSGPGRLTMALGIGKAENRANMTIPDSGLWIEIGQTIPDELVLTGPRVGLGKNVGEPWFTMPWRWWIKDNDYVS